LEVTVTRVRAELRRDTANVSTPSPRLSWVVTGPDGWAPQWSEIELDANRSVKSGAESVLVEWPFAPIQSRASHRVRVRVGDDAHASPWSEPLHVCGAFLGDDEWDAPMIGLPGDDVNKRPGRVRSEFEVDGDLQNAMLYATAHGVYQIEVNGSPVDDAILKPGWTSYQSRLVHETTDVTELVRPGTNVIGVDFAGGWFTEQYLGQPGPFYGAVPSVAVQLRLAFRDGRIEWVKSSADWSAARSPIVSSGIYAGEDYDARAEAPGWSQPGAIAVGWVPVRVDREPYPTPSAQISQPVRAVEEIRVVNVVTSASGEPILDFGQNLVGRLRIRVTGEAGTVVTLRHAEVLEDGELGVRPLRAARAADTYTLAGKGVEVWEPRFTFHGFRYAQITGLDVPPEDVVAVVISSDMERTGWFTSSNALLNRLHENVVWGMRGNFLSVPTDCPQRDERLGWTGDLQVFAPTASFLFDTAAFLDSWLVDLTIEQEAAGGIVPFVIPDPLPDGKRPAAAWGDAGTVVPFTLHQRFGDRQLLTRQLPSMKAWADVLVERAGPSLLWRGGFQFGDWLDPTAPPENPFDARTDPDLIASAYLFLSVDLVARAAKIVGEKAVTDRYSDLSARIKSAFQNQFITPAGLLSSDAQTAYAIAICFCLYSNVAQRRAMGERLADLVRTAGYRIATGFVGTPLVTDALTITGHTDAAERLLLQTENPSWLYPVTMGATTIWERWDSMLEDGSINQSGMTSFNHYAFGAVADWLHRVVAGLGPEEPGYRAIRIAPRPLKRLEFAAAEFESPYGRIRTGWRRENGSVIVEATVPTGVRAIVDLPGLDTFTVGSGQHRWMIESDVSAPAVPCLDWMTTPLSEIIDDEEAYDAIREELVAIDPVLADRYRRQVRWSRGFTLDESFRALSGGEGRRRVEQVLARLNGRRERD